MSKTVLIALLGNQDLQLRKSAKTNLESANWFRPNNDGIHWIIDKKLKPNTSFLSISERIKEEYEDYQEYIYFALIQPILDADLKGVDEIIFCTSAQSPLHNQDCLHIADIAVRYYQEKGYTCQHQLFDCAPVDFSALVDFFTTVFNKIEGDKVCIAASGGTPDMRSAIHFAGLFRKYTYFSIHPYADPSERISKKTFERQEALVLRSIVKKMLDVYDYEGISKLPVSQQIKEFCKEGINRYNFTNLFGFSSSTYDVQAKIGLAALYENLKLCYTQGRYADVVGRIFRIEEAIGHLLYYQILEDENILTATKEIELTERNGRITTVSYFNVLENQNKKKQVSLEYFDSLFDSRGNRFLQFSSPPLKSGKNFWYFFCKSLSKYPTVTSFFEPINNNYPSNIKQNHLTELRNKSILGHGFEGVSKVEVDNLTDGFEKFIKELKQLLTDELNIPISEEFEQINEKILAIIDQ